MSDIEQGVQDKASDAELRAKIDMFAASAINGYANLIRTCDRPDRMAREIAKCAYDLAEAMCKESERRS